ncbi:unnamed protein product [Darwinula stevensoni]|uniref:Ubiquitin carboxyl-terminal hydrolase MINDY n=1 Tax=Darwinula stevensoni TaxID=69355 RepID=A0A7R9AHE1_9CRUS|nr:unnamed protein product [Darwinula stevensoni]CAG0905115.1 unnamed protein product [Darwinula stevensoni]
MLEGGRVGGAAGQRGGGAASWRRPGRAASPSVKEVRSQVAFLALFSTECGWIGFRRACGLRWVQAREWRRRTIRLFPWEPCFGVRIVRSMSSNVGLKRGLQTPSVVSLSAGFMFSSDEPTALVQKEGGPCAVIAPVQGFILRSAMMEINPTPKELQDLKNISISSRNGLFVSSLSEILLQCSPNRNFKVATWKTPVRDDLSSTDEMHATGSEPKAVSLPAGSITSMEDFHNSLDFLAIQGLEQLRHHLTECISLLFNSFGVLLFLYSVIMSKACPNEVNLDDQGVEEMMEELEEGSESLIDRTHGHACQGLINMMLTGRAVSHVWDNNRDVGGLSTVFTFVTFDLVLVPMKGIKKRSEVGFLTLLEHHRYCEVGQFLKNPIYPIWLLGSETHLTVIFSFERNLVHQDTERDRAWRAFQNFDLEGKGFIPSASLADLMGSLDLVSLPEYVEIMRKKMDSEELGIIILSSFLDEFFPEEDSSHGSPERCPHFFSLCHYNGLPRSNPDGKVRLDEEYLSIYDGTGKNKVVYHEGKAEMSDGHLPVVQDASPILVCLQTKWPSLEVSWPHLAQVPSLN